MRNLVFFLVVLFPSLAFGEMFLTDIPYEVEIRTALVHKESVRLSSKIKFDFVDMFKSELREILGSNFTEEDDVQILPLILDKVEEKDSEWSTLSITVPLVSRKPLNPTSIPVKDFYFVQSSEDKDLSLAQDLPAKFFAPSSTFQTSLEGFKTLRRAIDKGGRFFDKRDAILALDGLTLVTVTEKAVRALPLTPPTPKSKDTGIKFAKRWAEKNLFPFPSVVSLFKSPVYFHGSLLSNYNLKITKRGLSKGLKEVEQAIVSTRNLKDLAKYVTDLKENTSIDPDYLRFLEYLLTVPDAEKREQMFKDGKGLYAKSLDEFKTDLNARLQADLGDMEVVKHKMGTGKHSLVSLVKDKKTGQLWALKRPLNGDKEHAASFTSEIERAKLWRKANITTIEVKWAPDGVSLLKSYVEGPTLREVLEESPKFLNDPKDPKRLALEAFLRKLAKIDVYFGDLNAKNIIFDGKEWQVIDSGGDSQKESVSKASQEYFEKLPLKWRRSITYSGQDAVQDFFDKTAREIFKIEKEKKKKKEKKRRSLCALILGFDDDGDLIY